MTTLALESGAVIAREDDGLLHVSMARPDKLNALTQGMYADLGRAVEHLAARDDLHALLIDGQGRSFCAGNDIKDFAAVKPGGRDPNRPNLAIEYIRRLMALDKPIVMAIQGNATGIGVTMLLHADLVIAADSARLHTPFIDLALVPEAGSSLLLPQLLGRQHAARMLLAGEPVTADEALQMGLVAYRCTDDELPARALALGKALAAKPRYAMQCTKQLLRQSSEVINAQIAKELELFGRCLVSDEAKAVFARFLAKKS